MKPTYEELLQKLSTANAAIAMKDKALETAKNGIKWYIENSIDSDGSDFEALHEIEAALSTSPESIAAWEAYDREHAAKVLEEAAQELFALNFANESDRWLRGICAGQLRGKAAELRAANKKEGE